MRRVASLPLLAAALLCLPGCHAPGRPAPAALHDSAHTAPPLRNAAARVPGFDLYLLALTWGPRFCCGHETRQECVDLATSFGATHLTLHGLWPNFSDEHAARREAPYPAFCGEYAACDSKEPPAFCRVDAATIPDRMRHLAPGYVADGRSLADHEWAKHGSCTGLGPGEFFAASVRAMDSLPSKAGEKGEGGTPALLTANVGKALRRTAIEGAFGAPGSVVLGCDASCRLTQVGVCLGRDGDGEPTGPVPCPDVVTTSDYDNGCATRACATVAIPAAGQCGAPAR